MTFSKIFKKFFQAFEWCGKDRNEPCKVHFFGNLKDLPGSYLNLLENQENVFLKPAYLLALEESKPLEMEFAYACVEKENLPVAVMYFQLLKVTLNNAESFLNSNYFGEELKSLSNGSSNIFLKNFFASPFYIMFCGNVFVSGEHGIHIEPRAYEPELLEALPPLMDEVIKRAGEAGKIAGVVVKDFYDHKMPDIPMLEKEGYRKFYFEPNMDMDIHENWMSFDDYMEDLASKYRIRAKNTLKKASEITIKEFSAADIRANRKTIEALYENVHKRAAVHFSGINANYFTNLKNNFSHDFSFKGFFLGDKLIAFSTLLCHQETGEAHLIGIDYHYNKSHALYPFILYQYIRDAIERRLKLLHFGRTAAEIKSTVGARAMQLYCYLGLQSPLSVKLLSPLLNSTKEKEMIIRYPFKESVNFPEVKA